MLRSHVIKAVFWRNLASYFSGVLGYLFIVVFVIACAAAAFSPRFFTNNLATLDQLSDYFPMLLLFIIPAVTMTSWAEEKRSGTDELLFTLPATDFEVLLGKYLATYAVYTVALLFSGVILVRLEVIADPDWGLLLTTYIGYWLAGGALLSAGMFASVLTNGVTVAFVLGVVACVVPVFGNYIAYSIAVSLPFLFVLGILLFVIAALTWNLLSNPNRRTIYGLVGCGVFFCLVSVAWWVTAYFKKVEFQISDFAAFSLAEQTRDFSLGIVSLTSLAYFVTMTAFWLYLNAVFIGKRHWSGGPYGATMSSHFIVRSVAMVAILISLNVFLARLSDALPLSLDLTNEKLFTLSTTTRELVRKIPSTQPVTIQAFISSDVPRDQVTIQKRLKGLLRQYDREGGSRVDVRFVDVKPFSQESEEARLLGIQPMQVMTDEDGRRGSQQIYMGVVISSPTDEVVIPVFEAGTSVEYELTRSIRTVATDKRLRVGILRTDARVTGGFDQTSFRQAPEWRIQTELKKQYKVDEVSPDLPIDGDKYDVLLAVMPSSLTQPQLQNLVEYVKSGKPTLIFDDPLPITIDGSGQMAPRLPKPRPGGMFGGFNQQPEQKADDGKLTSLMRAIEVHWDNGEVVFDITGAALHPEFGQLPPEYVFITNRKEFKSAFHPENPVTSELQEVLAIYPGNIKQNDGSELKFEALMRTMPDKSGVHEWEKLTRPGNPFGGGGVELNPNNVGVLQQDKSYTLAAHITGKPGKEGKPINVIFVADVDLIGNPLFNFEFQQQLQNLRIDNVKFTLNCVDKLAGEESFIELRKRRAQLRTLKSMQEITEGFRKEQNEKRAQAESEAKEQIDKLQKAMDEAVEAVRKNTSLTPIQQQQEIELIRQTKQRQLDVARANIERDKLQRIESISIKTQQKIRESEDGTRLTSILLAPLLPILLGIIVLSARINAEHRNIETDRLVKR